VLIRELERRGVRVEHVPTYAGADMPRWHRALESDYDAVLVAPGSIDMLSSPMGMAFIAAARARERVGRPRLFLSLVHDTVLPSLYARGQPVLLPETPAEAVHPLMTCWGRG
jgi:hypothetical protein